MLAIVKYNRNKPDRLQVKKSCHILLKALRLILRKRWSSCWHCCWHPPCRLCFFWFAAIALTSRGRSKPRETRIRCLFQDLVRLRFRPQRSVVVPNTTPGEVDAFVIRRLLCKGDVPTFDHCYRGLVPDPGGIAIVEVSQPYVTCAALYAQMLGHRALSSTSCWSCIFSPKD